MNAQKITNHQLFALTAFFTCGTTIIYISSSLAGFAKQDAWISAAITPAIGAPFLYIYSYLGKLYPDKTLVEIILTVFGKWIGGFVTLAFIVLCLIDVPQITWYVGNFVTQRMPGTPILVINAFVIVALVIGLFYGIEAIARSSEIFMLAISIMIILTLVLVSSKIKIVNIVPVFENGITPILQGSLLLISYTSWPLIVLNMIYPSLLDSLKKARKSYYKGYLWGSAIIFLCTIVAILVLGSNVSKASAFPTFLLAKEISTGSIIIRMEAIIATVWVITLFFKALIYFYAGVISISQLLKLKDNKKIILPLGLISLMLSVVVYPNSIYEGEWDQTIWIPFIASYSVVLPAILLIVTMIKRKMNKNKEKHVNKPQEQSPETP